MKIKDPFARVIVYALAGVAIGLLMGLLFGAIIMWIGIYLFADFDPGGLYQVAPFFAMGWGSVIGAVFGGVVALKK